MVRKRGIARVDRKTKHLAGRLQAGEIAVINHKDIDSTCARMLIERAPCMVVNASRSISGRYPNSGPRMLLDAGIAIVDDVGPEIMSSVVEGETIEIEGANVIRDGKVLASGTVLTPQLASQLAEESRSHLAAELDAFARNTLELITEEKFLILDPVEVPAVRARISGRHVLVVVRGEGFKEDLATIRSYLKEVKPVLVGVDGGADALLEQGFNPDIIVGDMDSISDDALRCGAEIVVHAYSDGRAPGMARVQDLGLDAFAFPIQGTSEDAAMMLAYEKGAELIVAVGTHSNLIDFLDKGRAGMASTFLTRLKVGSKLVDARGVNRLYRASPGAKSLAVLVAAALMPVLAVALQYPSVRTWIGLKLFLVRNLFIR